MNPVIVIPSYWDEDNTEPLLGEVGSYDHVTPLNSDRPELAACLGSLDEVRGVMRVVVLLVCPPYIEDKARSRVEEICAEHERLNICIIGSTEANAIKDRIHKIVPEMQGENISLRGYGAIRNMGFCVAAVLGHDCIVFIDDDEIALDPNFLIDAVYGLGRTNRQGLPLLVKSGYFQRADGSPYADTTDIRWYDKQWSKKANFNAWLSGALASTRISRSNVLCGGCMAVYAEAFMKVAFDPVIPRGEDLDYLINLRMYGIDVWFDNKWTVRHLPPPTKSPATRFLSDCYRWLYESQKVASSNALIKLRHVTVESLSPYPGKWISKEVMRPIVHTCKARAIGTSEHIVYYKILKKYLPRAQKYARQNAYSYISFMSFWPTIMSELWDDENTANMILQSGSVIAFSNADPDIPLEESMQV